MEEERRARKERNGDAVETRIRTLRWKRSRYGDFKERAVECVAWLEKGPFDLKTAKEGEEKRKDGESKELTDTPFQQTTALRRPPSRLPSRPRRLRLPRPPERSPDPRLPSRPAEVEVDTTAEALPETS
jgi:hypothetical protein